MISGPRCGSQEEEGMCTHSRSCLNGGICQEVSSGENHCLCPIGYDGPNCQYGMHLSLKKLMHSQIKLVTIFKINSLAKLTETQQLKS